MSDSVKKYYEDLPENELKAIEIAREKSQVMLGRSLSSYANLLYYIGRTDEAHNQYLEESELCKKFD